MAPEEPVLADCYFGHPIASTDEETFTTNLGWGEVKQRSLDLQLDSTPPIEFRRAYISDFLRPMAMGPGTSHSYDNWLSSDGVAALTYIKINHEDGNQEDLNRVSPGRGFNEGVVFEGRDDYGETYGARMTWAAGRFHLRYRDGAQSTFLPCSAVGCYWVGYQDAEGHTLRFDRGPRLELRELMASDQQELSLQSDDKGRIIEVTASNGQHVSYDYDASGCLARVTRADGQVTLYEYDPGHHMTAVSVVRKTGAPAETILANEYDSQGRVVKQTMAGGRSYEIHYIAARGRYTTEVDLTDPAGQVSRIRIGDNAWVAHLRPVRFHAVGQH
jgi:YD repeat-containing protein